MKTIKRHFRTLFQIIFTALTNGYLVGFAKGKIFQGSSKVVCVPGLNCYSCPGALGSCPIGSLQSALAGFDRSFPYYVVGLLMLFSVVLGRFVCGFLCPFGLVQDLLHKIKVPKMKMPKKLDAVLRYVKYGILIVFVIILPLSLVDDFGMGSPAFCKWICPSGTLLGGIPLVATNEGLQDIIGILFNWKLSLLIILLICSTFIYRPFCKYLCPLGGIYGLFNRFSLYTMKVDEEKCIHCKKCEKACKMNVQVLKNINSAECIRCGECQHACPTQCISSGFDFLKKNLKPMENTQNPKKTVVEMQK